MTRTHAATRLLGDAATYAMTTACFGGLVIAVEAALSRLVS
jgi:hypothetical protein